MRSKWFKVASRQLPAIFLTIATSAFIGTGQLLNLFFWLDKHDILWAFFAVFFSIPIVIYLPPFIKNVRAGMREAESESQTDSYPHR